MTEMPTGRSVISKCNLVSSETRASGMGKAVGLSEESDMMADDKNTSVKQGHLRLRRVQS